MLTLEERERRVKAIQEKMGERRIDVLLVSSSSDLSERGKLRCISYCTTELFDNYIILPKKGEMKYFGHYGHKRCSPLCWKGFAGYSYIDHFPPNRPLAA